MTEHRRDLTAIFKASIYVLMTGLVIYVALSCGNDDGAGSKSWQCEVTLTLVPSRMGDLSSPSGSGTGTGSGATEEEAMRAALQTACSQLNLSGEAKTRCESGQDFDVAVSFGGITLASVVNRSVQCGTN